MLTLVQQYFELSAQRSPDKVAIGCKDERVSYRDLDALSNAHARRLQEIGLTRGSFVPFFMKKSVNSMRAMLSVLKADCAYVPLDATSPAHRLKEILESTAATIVIVDSGSKQAFADRCGDLTGITLYEIDSDPGTSSDPIDYRNLSIDVAYVLFTSGSTGKPKGVMISHQMIIDYIDWCAETYAITDNDVIANHAPLYFDNSTFDIYSAFRAGATLHLVHDELNLILSKLIPWLEKRAVTIMFCVPSVMTILLKSGRLKSESFPTLRHVIAAGEVLPTDVVRHWMSLYPRIQFTNMYGPTEITVDCTFHVIATQPNAADVIPIGKARRNMEVFALLDDGTLSTEPGVTGEIVVRGKSVAYGYLNNPERTQAAFIQNPRHNLFHDPLYRTGDLAQIAADGSFVFIGRRDQQIKYMGNRIELGEIEAALMRIKGVTEAVVVFHDAPNVEDKCIGAIVCLGAEATKESVLAQLQKEVPGYMVPRKVDISAELPRTPNGKADRRAALEALFGTNRS